MKLNDIRGSFQHLKPLFTEDGGHGMIFERSGERYLVLHVPNRSGEEHPVILQIAEFEKM